MYTGQCLITLWVQIGTVREVGTTEWCEQIEGQRQNYVSRRKNLNMLTKLENFKQYYLLH